MGQGQTSSPGTYSRLKDIATGPIPEPKGQPELSECMEGVAFGHFMDNDFGGAPDFERLFRFLHFYYFPRITWAFLTLHLKKSKFFVSEIDILGHHLKETGLRPSIGRMDAFKKWPVPTDERSLLEFLYALPFVRSFIPGRADIDTFLRTAIIQEASEFKKDGKKRRRKRMVGFN